MFIRAVLISLLGFLLAVSAFAQAKSEKDTTVVLRGEHKPGEGYKVYFSEDKQKFLELTGYARLSSLNYMDDKHQTAPNNKVTMPYFRFWLNGQDSKELSFHVRLDYRLNTFKNTNNQTSAGIYFARAFGTYAFTDNFSVDLGRIDNLFHAYDVLNTGEVAVTYGVRAKYVLGDLTLKAGVNYNTPNQRQGGDDVDSQLKHEVAIWAAAAHYKYKINKEHSLSFGISGLADSKHHDSKSFAFLPSFGYNGPYELYLLNQSVMKKFDKNVKKKREDINLQDTYENYTEIGIGYKGRWYPDLQYRITRVPAAPLSYRPNDYNIYTQHEFGMELVYKFTATLYGLVNLAYVDFNTQEGKSTARAKKLTTFIHWDF